jgi:hypothetical protein
VDRRCFTGAAQVNWPTAIFDISMSPYIYVPIHTVNCTSLIPKTDTIVDNTNGKLECFGNEATSC